MAENLFSQLSRRERQIMDIVFRRGEVTAAEIQALLPNAPGNSSIRVLLRILEDKGFLTHRLEQGRYIYKPTIAPEQAQQSALKHLLKTFFADSAPQIVAALLSTTDLTEEELDELAQMIDQARKGEQ